MIHGYIQVPRGHWEHYSWTARENLWAEIARLRRELFAARLEQNTDRKE